jgi:hypothetical protein
MEPVKLAFVLVMALALAPEVVGARSVLIGEPGWAPPVDPDSIAARTGRRPAPLVTGSFAGGAPSLEALARELLRAAAAGDRARLSGLCVDRAEFSRILWPEFPQSRPITGASADDGWYFLERRNTGGVGRLLADREGQPLELVRVEKGAIDRYRNFRLHRGLTIVARRADGGLVRIDDLRTVAERKGAFKIYSLRD